MKINLKKIFRISPSRSSVIDNVKIIRSTKRLRTISLQIKIIIIDLYIKLNFQKDFEKILM